MPLRVQSRHRAASGHRTIVARSFYSIWSWLLVPHLMAQTDSKLPAQQPASSTVRFEVCDGEDNLPVA